MKWKLQLLAITFLGTPNLVRAVLPSASSLGKQQPQLFTCAWDQDAFFTDVLLPSPILKDLEKQIPSAKHRHRGTAHPHQSHTFPPPQTSSPLAAMSVLKKLILKVNLCEHDFVQLGHQSARPLYFHAYQTNSLKDIGIGFFSFQFLSCRSHMWCHLTTWRYL